MNRRSRIGILGEDLGQKYLLDKGYVIIERNFRKPWGELDIIAKDGNGILVFVEVKTLYNNVSRETYSNLTPEDNLTRSKLFKLQKTALLYVGHNQDLINDKGFRIDLLAITISGVSRETIMDENVNLTDIIKYCDIKHYENIF